MHSNWTICSPFTPFCSDILATFSLSYWEANSYYPRGPIMEKGNSSNPKSGWDRGFSVPGAFKLEHLHPIKPLLFKKFSNFFTFILGGQFLLPQRANNGMGIHPTLKLDETEGSQCLGHLNWTIGIMLTPFAGGNFPTARYGIWADQLYCRKSRFAGGNVGRAGRRKETAQFILWTQWPCASASVASPRPTHHGQPEFYLLRCSRCRKNVLIFIVPSTKSEHFL